MTWQPIYLDPYPFQRGNDGWTITPPKAEWDTWKREHPERCRDCGTTKHLHASGTHAGGRFSPYTLCDACAKIDACRDRLGDGTHVSHWGYPHTVAEHHELEAEQERRRTAYRRAHPAERQGALF